MASLALGIALSHGLFIPTGLVLAVRGAALLLSYGTAGRQVLRPALLKIVFAFC